MNPDRTAARLGNPHRNRLDEIDAELDQIAANLAATVQESKDRRYALMRERAPLLNDEERSINLWGYMETSFAASDWAKTLTINELCVYVMGHLDDYDARLDAALDRLYDLAGYQPDSELDTSTNSTILST